MNKKYLVIIFLAILIALGVFLYFNSADDSDIDDNYIDSGVEDTRDNQEASEDNLDPNIEDTDDQTDADDEINETIDEIDTLLEDIDEDSDFEDLEDF